NTLANAADDATWLLSTGSGSGNLPSTTVNSLAIDKNDNLWIGTADGIAILYNASSAIRLKSDAETPVVQYDQYAGYLFKGEIVRAIAVDGANRKWIGTDNGVWLLSPDAVNSSILLRFTTQNSPLPDNRIRKITIDNVTGIVYIGTENGVVAYRGTATEGGKTNGDVKSFPNPVPPGYQGTIAIKGLATNADVRITDMSGQLIYRTTALGGQAIWNGKDYTGRRPASGVYLIFATNTDGSQTYSGKMVFME
ncbi:MAG: T9SS C-terminal target domain-containing protein, partial [Chitinophagia bacterium]|nr:T9SS C-terminal target domain-containing protein [Chitinophagia bacterium]